MIGKLLLVLGYYLTQPLTWGVCLAASLVVAYHPNWRIGFVLVALSSYVWLMMIALVSYERAGMGIVAKSYGPATLVASAVFTQPEMGSIGLSEEAARALEPIEVYSTAFRPMQTAFAGQPDRVMMKLVVSAATRRVLGCHIVAPGAGEMIQLAAIAIKMGATKEDFDRTVAVHPTMSEELVTMRKPTRTA